VRLDPGLRREAISPFAFFASLRVRRTAEMSHAKNAKNAKAPGPAEICPVHGERCSPAKAGAQRHRGKYRIPAFAGDPGGGQARRLADHRALSLGLG
jgi:hypothetical protein